MDEFERMQKNLLLIRRVVGWSAEEFGEKIGVTRQTINNIERENPTTKLSKTQYIAIRYVLDDEMKKHPEDTKMLNDILEVFIDNPDDYSENQKKELMSKAQMIAPSVLAKTATREEVDSVWEDIFASIIVGASIAAATALVASDSKLVKKTTDWFERISK